MSAIDKIGFRRMPPVGVLPLGTGNDLSRSLDWGPGYTDSCLKKILNQLERANVEQMDRWHIETSEPTRELPLNVMNNYFSIGVDANTSLKFHSERGKLSRTLYLAWQTKIVNKTKPSFQRQIQKSSTRDLATWSSMLIMAWQNSFDSKHRVGRCGSTSPLCAMGSISLEN